jgi:hypothetical protein
MVALAHQKRRVPHRLWQAARALYTSDPSVTLPMIAERFGVSLAALKKHSSREKWRDGLEQGCTGYPKHGSPAVKAEPVPAITSRAEYRALIRKEALEWLWLLRGVRVVAGNDALDAIRQAAPLLARLARMETAFDEPKSEWHCLLHPSVYDGLPLPPRVDRDKDAEQSAAHETDGTTPGD